MHQPRILAKGEAALRDPASGSPNLVDAAGGWCQLAPRFDDERLEISGLGLTLVGPGLLQRLEAFGAASGALELGVLGLDGYGAVRDLAAAAPQVLGAADDWNAGAHAGTFADAEAGAQRDGSRRVGLRGVPLRSAGGVGPATWRSAALDLRYGASVGAVSWDLWTLRDARGQTVGAPTVELRAGTRAAGGLIAWGPFQSIAASAGEVDRGYRDLAAPLAGDVAQLQVTLPYVDPGTAVTPPDSVLHTATLFALCLWVNLAHSRWRFTSVAEIVERSELVRHLATAAWAGTDDVVLVRLPMSFLLRGRHGESIRARLTGGAASSLTRVEVHVHADLRFEPRAR